MKSVIATLLLMVPGLSYAAEDKAAFGEISAAFNEIEAHYKEWPHYLCSGENLEGGQGFEQHVWKSDGDRGFVKVESSNFDEHGVSKMQYYLKEGRLLFTLDRAETSLMTPKAPTDVVEKRCYFGNEQLIRLLEKKGQFPAGTSTDTVGIKNRELPLNGDKTPGETYAAQRQMALGIIERARILEGDDAPAQGAQSGPADIVIGKGWRMIAGSVSRDGMYALAWGLKGKSTVVGEADDNGYLSVDADDAEIMNYVVNLRSKEIVGAIAGKHFGDKTRYNHMTHEAEWSGDSQFVAQVCDAKWASLSAGVYQIVNDAKVSPETDLIAPARAAAFKKLKGSPQLKKFKEDDFAITLSDVRIMQRSSAAVLQAGVYGEVPKNGDDDSFFECTVTFSLSADENGGAPVLKWISTELEAQ